MKFQEDKGVRFCLEPEASDTMNKIAQPQLQKFASTIAWFFKTKAKEPCDPKQAWVFNIHKTREVDDLCKHTF